MDETRVKSEAYSPTPVSKFEDSPVFNYINKLSPIKPLGSPVSGQPFHYLSFASPKTSIVSPVTDCPRESKTTSDLLCPQSESSDGRNAIQPAVSHCENSECSKSSIVEADSTVDEQLKSDLEFGQVRQNDQGLQSVETNARKMKCYETRVGVVEPNDFTGPDARRCGAMKHYFLSKMTKLDTSSMLLHDDFSRNEKCFSKDKMDLDKAHLHQIKASEGENEWRKLLCEASDSLLCNSPVEEGHFQELDGMYMDPGTLSFVENILQPSQENTDGIQNDDTLLCSSEEHDLEMPLAFAEESRMANEAHQFSACTQFADEAAPSSIAEADIKPQMVLRRRLLYEMSGSQYRKIVSESFEHSMVSGQSANIAATHLEESFHSKPEIGNFSSRLPGIGLHLNALATSGRDNKVILKQEGVNSRRQLMSIPSASMPSPSASCDGTKESTHRDLNPSADSETHTERVQPVKDDNQSLKIEGFEGLKPSSAKRKRSKAENPGDDESCKRCNCKRSKCLKLYCECFAAGLYCVEPCSCQGCFNKPEYEGTVLETRRLIEVRNPLAFAPKVINVPDISEHGDEQSTTPASARHKRGCNCKKSSCLKKYCECFQGGVGCSFSCRCEGCKNSFGRKYGIEVSVYEETARGNNDIAASFGDTVDAEHQDPGVTPSAQISRSLLQQCTSDRRLRIDLDCHPGVESQRQKKIKEEDEAVDALNDGSNSLTSTTGIKSVSPNSKRVSPPRVGTEQTPVRRFCRKLILRSVPSFPALPDKSED